MLPGPVPFLRKASRGPADEPSWRSVRLPDRTAAIPSLLPRAILPRPPNGPRAVPRKVPSTDTFDLVSGCISMDVRLLLPEEKEDGQRLSASLTSDRRCV